MSNILVEVNDQNLYITDSPKIAAQGVNENYVKFTFSSDWDGFAKVAIFYTDEDPETVYQSIVDSTGTAAVPWEVTNDERKICLGVSGVKGDVVKTSEILKYKIVKGLYVVESSAPSPGIYEQMLALAGDIMDIDVAIRNYVENIVVPKASVIQTGTGARITITDENGTTTANIENGTATDAQVMTYVNSWLGEHPEATTTVQDGSVTMEKLGTDILAAMNTGGGLTEDVKQALLACFDNVTWGDDDPTGRSYIDALEDALYPPANLVSISAVYTPSGTVYDTDTIDSLKTDLVVTAHYDNGTTNIITTYVLSGTLTAGTRTILVTYGGKSASFTVTVIERYVLPSGYTKYDYVTNSSTSNCYVDTGIAFTYCAPEYHHKIKFRVPTYPSSETTIYGARGEHFGGTWATENLLSFGNTGILRMGFCGANNQNLYTASENELIEFEQYHQNLTVNGNVVLTATGTGTYNTVVAPVCLFGYAYGTSTAAYASTSMQFKIYEYSITDGNGNEIIHLQPCTNGSGQAGFYDFVSDTFKTAATVTSLSCGNDAA